MTNSTWQASPTTSGRSVNSQYKPDHLKQWIRQEDRLHRKMAEGSEAAPQGHNGLQRPSLFMASTGKVSEIRYNCNSKCLAELRLYQTPLAAGSPPTSPIASPTAGDLAATAAKAVVFQRIIAPPLPKYSHTHHYGWNPPSPKAVGPVSAAAKYGDAMKFCEKVHNVHAMISTRKA